MRFREISRRQFVAGAATTGLVVGTCLPTSEAQASGTMTVWRLHADWTEPRGPNNKTRLESMASRKASANRWAVTEQNALDMNLHVGSWAPAYPVQVNSAEFMSIWDHPQGSYVWRNPWKNVDVRIFDERNLADIPNGPAVFAAALAPAPQAPRLVFTPVSEPAAAAAATSPAAPVAPVAAQSRVTQSAPVIAHTGAESSLLGTLGFGLVAAGAGLARLAQRRREIEER